MKIACSTLRLSLMACLVFLETRVLSNGAENHGIYLLQTTVDTTGRPVVPAYMTARPTSRGTGLFLVQFEPPLHSTLRRRLETLGINVIGYVPEHAFLVEATPDTLAAVATWSDVRWLGEYKPEYKLAETVRNRTRWSSTTARQARDNMGPPADVVILVPRAQDAHAVAKAIVAGGGQLHAMDKSAREAWIRAAIPTALIESLAERSDVQWIEGFRPLKLCNDVAVQPGRLDAQAVWTNWGLTGNGQVIGHADTGLDVGDLETLHTDFYGRVIAAFAWGRPYQYLIAEHEPVASPATITLLSGQSGGWDACAIEPETTAVGRVVQLQLSRAGTNVAEGYLVCRIHHDDGGAPGALMTGAVSEPLDAIFITTNTADWQTFLFTNAFSLTSGAPYWIVLDASSVTAGTLQAGYSTTLLKNYHARTMDSGTNWFLEKRWVYHRVGGPPDWSDPHGHGTHTAGSILGNGVASTGRYRGVAFEAALVHQSVMDPDGGLGGIPTDTKRLYLEAYQNGARIHSDSWGGVAAGAYDSYAQQADTFIWEHPDMLIVVAAGNEGQDHDAPFGVVDEDSLLTPGTAKNVLTVGASENFRPEKTNTYRVGFFDFDFPFEPISTDRMANASSGMAAFSSRGPCDDGRIKPDVVAPGTFVISCQSRHPDAGDGWGPVDSNYVYRGGTSMATPLTAGAAALVRQFYVERKGATNPSAALIKATIINGAQSMAPGQYGEGAAQEIPHFHPNCVEGWGRVNLEGSLFPTNRRRIVFFDGATLETGETNEFYVGVISTGVLAVTLAYSDYPGTLGAATSLVNDLDLLVEGPHGTNYWPNELGLPDPLNNVENTDITAAPGRWKIMVSGRYVPFGPQPYALVLSGDIAPAVYCTANVPSAGMIELSWETQKDFRYSIEQANDIEGPWNPMSEWTNLPGTGARLFVTNALGEENVLFLRVAAQPDI